MRTQAEARLRALHRVYPTVLLRRQRSSYCLWVDGRLFCDGTAPGAIELAWRVLA